MQIGRYVYICREQGHCAAPAACEVRTVLSFGRHSPQAVRRPAVQQDPQAMLPAQPVSTTLYLLYP